MLKGFALFTTPFLALIVLYLICAMAFNAGVLTERAAQGEDSFVQQNVSSLMTCNKILFDLWKQDLGAAYPSYSFCDAFIKAQNAHRNKGK